MVCLNTRYVLKALRSRLHRNWAGPTLCLTIIHLYMQCIQCHD